MKGKFTEQCQKLFRAQQKGNQHLGKPQLILGSGYWCQGLLYTHRDGKTGLGGYSACVAKEPGDPLSQSFLSRDINTRQAPPPALSC